MPEERDFGYPRRMQECQRSQWHRRNQCISKSRSRIFVPDRCDMERIAGWGIMTIIRNSLGTERTFPNLDFSFWCCNVKITIFTKETSISPLGNPELIKSPFFFLNLPEFHINPLLSKATEFSPSPFSPFEDAMTMKIPVLNQNSARHFDPNK